MATSQNEEASAEVTPGANGDSPIEGSPRARAPKRSQEDDYDLLAQEHLLGPQAHARRLAPSLFCYAGGAQYQEVSGRAFGEIYEMLDELGAGVSSTVYRVQDRQTKELRALKVVYNESFGDGYDLETDDDTPFEAEMNVLRAVDHPHIIRLFDCFESPGSRAFAMELCTGGNLLEYFGSLTVFGEDTVAAVVRQIASATAHLHGMQICHCDLKPENILVTSATYMAELPDCPYIKLADFGVATSRPERAVGVGASEYASPEVLLDNLPCDQSGDMWSIGMVAFILLSGLEPHVVRTTVLEHGLVPDIQGVSEVGLDAVTWCLDRSAAHRPSAAALLSHDWMMNTLPSEGPSGLCDVLNRLHQFRRLSKLQQAMLQIVAYSMPVDQLSELAAAFEALDTDHDGKLSLTEVEYGLARVCPDEKKRMTTFKAMDFDENESIHYSEFVAACLTRKQCMQRDVLWRVFCAVDLDGSGTISHSDLKTALQSPTMRQFFGDKWIERMFSSMDSDRSGQVDFDEFCVMMQDRVAASTPSGVGIGPRRDSFAITPSSAGIGPRRQSFGFISLGPRKDSHEVSGGSVTPPAVSIGPRKDSLLSGASAGGPSQTQSAGESSPNSETAA